MKRLLLTVVVSLTGCWPNNTGPVPTCVEACGVGCQAPGSRCYSDGHAYCSDCAAACSQATPVACDSPDGGPAACAAACFGGDAGCQNPASVCYSDGHGYCSDCAATCYGATRVACPVDVCTVGHDETCNANPTMSALAGQCLGNPAHCVCSTGFVVDTSGKCRLAGTCVPGQDQTCNYELAMQSFAGHCVDGTPPSCSCNVGFTLDGPTGQCRRTVCVAGDDRTCNQDPTRLELGGHCVAGTQCQCFNNGYTNDPVTGRCYDQLSTLCLLTVGSSTCRYELRDGGVPPTGVCGSTSLSVGCVCVKTSGAFEQRCTGACLPSADGGTQRTCSTPNCGAMTCSTGSTCVAPNSCQ